MTTDDGQPATTAGPCNDETVIVPPLPHAASELAWSAAEPDEPAARRSWRSAWSIAGMVVLLAAVVAVAITGLGAASEPGATTVPTMLPQPLPAAALPPISSEAVAAPVAAPPSTVTVTPKLPAPTTVTVQAPAPVPIAPAPKASAPDADQVFRNFVLQVPGIRVVNWSVAESGARGVCAYLGQGHSHDDAAHQVLANDPTFTAWQASAMVNASATAYCPQYGHGFNDGD